MNDNELKLMLDDIETNDDGSKWTSVCMECVEKLKLNKNNLDESGSGCCMIQGCNNSDENDENIDIRYYDFK